MNPPMLPHPGHRFPPDFVWGVATSAFQIEGAATADGKGEWTFDPFIVQNGNQIVAFDPYDTKTAVEGELFERRLVLGLRWNGTEGEGGGEKKASHHADPLAGVCGTNLTQAMAVTRARVTVLEAISGIEPRTRP